MSDPTTVKPHELLARGAGHFVGDESMPPAPWAPDGMQSQGTIDAKAVFGGQGLVSRYEQRVDGKVVQASVTLIRRNEAKGVFTMHFFGGPEAEPTAFTGTAKGDRITFNQDGDKPTMRQEFLYREDGFDVLAEMYAEGNETWSEAFRGSYRREQATAEAGR